MPQVSTNHSMRIGDSDRMPCRRSRPVAFNVWMVIEGGRGRFPRNARRVPRFQVLLATETEVVVAVLLPARFIVLRLRAIITNSYRVFSEPLGVGDDCRLATISFIAAMSRISAKEKR